MSEPQIQVLLGLVAEGLGVEAALASMGVDVNIALDELKKHPSAKGLISDAKKQGVIALVAAKALKAQKAALAEVQ